jgi:surface carbohydrate biosynthesis protein
MTQSNKIKTLVFLDYDKGRDVEILMPLLYYGEKYLNLDIKKAFIFDIDKIRREKPDLVILANTIGSKNHHCIAKYAYENGIKVFALISEGNFRTNGTFDYWGYNTDKKFYQEYVCFWSKRTKKFMEKELPQYKEKFVLTGATGFDRYKIYDFETKESFLKRYNLSQYKKVIGYAGWAFGKLYNPTGLMEIRSTYKEKADDFIEWMKKQQKLVEDILRKAVENNPDTLFILKRHPNEIHPHLVQKDNNEMINLADYPNVLYLRNEEDVHTLISVSDMWLAFESTTVIEAWLMKKDMPTIFINPDPDFNRDINYKGVIIAKDYEKLQNLINEYYSTGKVEEMFSPEKIKSRKEIFEHVIGFPDGFNHIRAGYYLSKTVNKIKSEKHKKKVKINPLYYSRYILTKIGTPFYNKALISKLPKLKKTVWVFERQKLKNFEPLKEKYYKYLDKFHQEHKISEKIKSEEFFEQLLKNPMI